MNTEAGKTREFRVGEFCMDALTGIFEGYTVGDNWNGWACPYFERNIAERVLSASSENGYRWSYNAERDTFTVTNVDDPEDYEPEEYQATIIKVAGEEIKVYPVGAYYWMWEECVES